MSHNRSLDLVGHMTPHAPIYRPLFPLQLRKRKHATGGAPETAKVCRACEGHHATRHCFYLFQERAPETWTPRPHLQKLVEQNLKDDPTLEEETKRWTKSGRRNGEVAVD